MSRKADFKERQQTFIEFMDANKCPVNDKDNKLAMFNANYATELMCDLTDAVCSMAKSMKGIQSELYEIRRRI